MLTHSQFLMLAVLERAIADLHSPSAHVPSHCCLSQLGRELGCTSTRLDGRPRSRPLRPAGQGLAGCRRQAHRGLLPHRTGPYETAARAAGSACRIR